MAPSTSFDPYAILGIEKGCDEKDIQKAYKVQCLKWHPDKNRDNEEEAAKRFIEAKKAFEFLYNKDQRIEYDTKVEKVARQEQAKRERNEKLDAHRRILTEELQRRERDAEESKPTPLQTERMKKREFTRIRADFNELREQLEREVAEEMKKQQERQAQLIKQNRDQAPVVENAKLRVKWDSKVKDYSEEELRSIFDKYGTISHIVNVLKKKKMCIIEYEIGTAIHGAELEDSQGLEASWITPPSVGGEVKSSTHNVETDKAEPADVYSGMSFEDLEAQILGPTPPEKRKKWNED